MLTGKQIIDVLEDNLPKISKSYDTFASDILNLLEGLSAEEIDYIVNYGEMLVKE